jgi:hypothetical protein
MPEPASEQALLERIRSAAVVAVGRVTEVRKVAGLQSSGGGRRSPISEHNPRIAEAVIEVTEGIKGTETGDKILVRFPTSTDVMWYRYPKFEVGHSGVFILQPDRLTAGLTAFATEATSSAYNASHPDDALPLAAADRVRKIVQRSEKPN